MPASNLQQHLADDDAHVQYLREDVLVASGDMIYADANGEPVRLPIGAHGWVLMVDLASPYKPVWVYIGRVAIPKNALQNKGDLLVGLGGGAYGVLPVGPDGYVLSADSAELTGLKWVPATVIPTCPYALDFSYECDSGYIALL